MTKEINIKLSAEHVVAKAGEKVRIVANFDKLAYASVNERGDVRGYVNVIRTAEKVSGNTPTGESAWCVSLPSLSKSKYVSPDKDQSQRLYEDAEFTIMEVYERGIRLKGYKLREDNRNVFDPASPLLEQDIQLI